MDLAENVEIKPAVNQLKTNVFSQQWDSEREMEQYGTKIMAWAPIAQADADLFENPTLQAIAESHGRTVAQVALRYLIQRGIDVKVPKAVAEVLEHSIKQDAEAARKSQAMQAAAGTQMMTI